MREKHRRCLPIVWQSENIRVERRGTWVKSCSAGVLNFASASGRDHWVKDARTTLCPRCRLAARYHLLSNRMLCSRAGRGVEVNAALQRALDTFFFESRLTRIRRTRSACQLEVGKSDRAIESHLVAETLENFFLGIGSSVVGDVARRALQISFVLNENEGGDTDWQGRQKARRLRRAIADRDSFSPTARRQGSGCSKGRKSESHGA